VNVIARPNYSTREIILHIAKPSSEYDSGWCQGLLELHAHINTQIDKPNSQTKKIIEIIVWMLESESDTPPEL
jgi:hypothetical protein